MQTPPEASRAEAHLFCVTTSPSPQAAPRSQGEVSQGARGYLMLMANSAASFTLCRTRNVPSERLVRMLSAPARSMGPAYLPRHIEEVHRVPMPGPPCCDMEATVSSDHCNFFLSDSLGPTALRHFPEREDTYPEGSYLGLTLRAEPSSRFHTGANCTDHLPILRSCHLSQSLSGFLHLYVTRIFTNPSEQLHSNQSGQCL